MSSSAVNYFRPRVAGPESVLEDHVAVNLSSEFSGMDNWWIGGSLPLGAGIPDLVAVSYEPELERVSQFNRAAIEVLAYLRAVRTARLDTVTDRLQLTALEAESIVADLHNAGAIDSSHDLLTLADPWRAVLPEVVAIEVKVSDWKRALSQATRNLVFCHRTFVALPEGIASRVRSREEFSRLGVGVLSISDSGDVSVARRARRAAPRSWRYYYELAFRVSLMGAGVAVPCPD